MNIGNIALGEHPVLLAPMEDVTDIGFRLLCKQLGAGMVYSEFVSCDALTRMVNKSLQKLAVCDEERPVAIQIYGKDPKEMARAAKIVIDRSHPDILDINFGCPVKRVAGKGAGAGMLRNVPLMLEITREVVKGIRGVNSDGVIASLVDKGLVRELGRDPQRGQAIIYGTTNAFLEKFGLRSTRDLPDLEQFAPDEQSRQFIRERLSGRSIQSTLEEQAEDLDEERELIDTDVEDVEAVADEELLVADNT